MNYKKLYSSKRKPDLVTFFAFIVFAVLIAFQIFVTLVAPQLIRRNNALNVAKQRELMFQDIDQLRGLANRVTVGKNDAAGIEKTLLLDNLNDMALYIRNNHLVMNAEQIATMNERIKKNRMIVERWRGNKTKPFHFKREEPNVSPYLQKLEQAIKSKESSQK